MYDILQSIRGLILDHLDNTQPILADLPVGNTVVFVPNTSRFRVNDEIYIMAPVDSTHLLAPDLIEPAWIVEIPEYNQLIISTVDPNSSLYVSPVGSTRLWLVSENTQIHKAIQHQPLKGVHIGDIRPIPDFPTITVSPASEDSEWLTFGGSSHNYKTTIRVYVLADNFETTEKLLSKTAKQVREILFDHIHLPIDFTPYPLTADVPTGGTVVSVASTAKFFPGAFTFIRDAKKRPFISQVAYVRSVLSSTDLELSCSLENDYLVARQAEILLCRRYLYDTRPDSISYGFVPGTGGSFMRAAEISYFGKEMVLREPPVILT